MVRRDILLLPLSGVEGMTAHQRAAWNRNMVANHERVEFYLKVENVVQNTPHNKRLPKWVPVYDSTYMVGQFD